MFTAWQAIYKTINLSLDCKIKVVLSADNTENSKWNYRL